MSELIVKKKKTWREKLADDNNLPKVKPIPEKMQKRWGKGTLVIPAPHEVNEIIRTVPKEKLITISQIAERLAKKHNTTIGCNITTGIFAWIAAHAANEDELEGKKRITPYWRAVKKGGELNPKYPGGVVNLKKRLESEGHVVFNKGKRFLVEDYELKLVKN